MRQDCHSGTDLPTICIDNTENKLQVFQQYSCTYSLMPTTSVNLTDHAKSSHATKQLKCEDRKATVRLFTSQTCTCLSQYRSNYLLRLWRKVLYGMWLLWLHSYGRDWKKITSCKQFSKTCTPLSAQSSSELLLPLPSQSHYFYRPFFFFPAESSIAFLLYSSSVLYVANGEHCNESFFQLADLIVHAPTSDPALPRKNFVTYPYCPTSSMVARISEITEKKRMHWSFSLAKDFYLTVLTEANKSLNYWNENLNPSLLLSLLPCSL